MSKSGDVRVRDVARILRLSRELQEMPADPAARMSHLALSLCRHFGGKLGVIGYGKDFRAGGHPTYTFAVDGGWVEARERAVYARYLRGDHSADPCVPPIALLQSRNFARRRRTLVNDSDWYRSDHVNQERREAGVDDVMYSVRRLDRNGHLQMMALHRPWGDTRLFSERDQVVFRLVHEAVARLVELPRDLSAANTLASQLSPRLHETLTLLLSGEPEKTIASGLGLSHHTVHGYVKEIYAHFKVRSRAELSAQWISQSILPS